LIPICGSLDFAAHSIKINVAGLNNIEPFVLFSPEHTPELAKAR
jgi:hypothetical protein